MVLAGTGGCTAYDVVLILKRGFDGHVIDASGEDFFEVIGRFECFDGHGA